MHTCVPLLFKIVQSGYLSNIDNVLFIEALSSQGAALRTSLAVAVGIPGSSSSSSISSFILSSRLLLILLLLCILLLLLLLPFFFFFFEFLFKYFLVMVVHFLLEVWHCGVGDLDSVPVEQRVERVASWNSVGQSLKHLLGHICLHIELMGRIEEELPFLS